MTWEAASGRRDGSDLLPGVTLEGTQEERPGQRAEETEARVQGAEVSGGYRAGIRGEGDTGMKPGDCHGAAACEEGAQR